MGKVVPFKFKGKTAKEKAVTLAILRPDLPMDRLEGLANGRRSVYTADPCPSGDTAQVQTVEPEPTLGDLTLRIRRLTASVRLETAKLLDDYNRNSEGQTNKPEYVWMYCFQCGCSHYFEEFPNGMWRCPNCHALKPTHRGLNQRRRKR